VEKGNPDAHLDGAGREKLGQQRQTLDKYMQEVVVPRTTHLMQLGAAPGSAETCLQSAQGPPILLSGTPSTASHAIVPEAILQVCRHSFLLFQSLCFFLLACQPLLCFALTSVHPSSSRFFFSSVFACWLSEDRASVLRTCDIRM
jgi:hypothetical protein